jgi:uncharacterized damage-inducible protein DinB
MYLDQITAAEKEVDSEITQKLAENQELQEKLLTEEKQVQMRRQKIMDQVF